MEIFRNLVGSEHRSESFNREMFPLCQPLIEAIGNRMAYESAKQAGIDPQLLALYEAGAIKQDSAWYTEVGGLTRREQNAMEERAVDALLPRLETLLDETGAAAYAQAPILNEKLWEEFVRDLHEYKGAAASRRSENPVVELTELTKL